MTRLTIASASCRERQPSPESERCSSAPRICSGAWPSWASRSRATTPDRSLLLVGVLKGAVFFLSDLMRFIDIPVEVDFMAVASYGSATDSSGVVRILKDLDAAIEGRDVLIVEDIVDSGLTLQYLLRNLGSRNPRTLEVCALLTKPERRKVDLPTRYVGFEIPDRFVVGYGLDYAERHRNLPFVARLETLAGIPALPRYADDWRANRRKVVAAHGTLGTGDPRLQTVPDRQDLAMSRFFKSAAFPILIVVVLAFLAVKLVNPGSTNHHPHSYQTLVGGRAPERRSQVGRAQEQGQSA